MTLIEGRIRQCAVAAVRAVFMLGAVWFAVAATPGREAAEGHLRQVVVAVPGAYAPVLM